LKDWYEALESYFPESEMKHRGQMEELLEKHEAYFKHVTDDVVVTYADFPDCVFIDYLLVKPTARGRGVGGAVLDAFKRKNKIIIVEVEPEEAEDADTVRRVRFYERHGFVRADRIDYVRETQSGEPIPMDIYYWSPADVSEETILQQMATIYQEIHNFKASKYYRKPLADSDDVLTLKSLD
jgi:GNAT superfamily N-acetyltransferase